MLPFLQSLQERLLGAGSVIFSTLVPGSGSFQLSDLAGLGNGLGLGFWVVFTI